MIIRVEKDSDITVIETLTYSAFKDHPHHEPGSEPTEHLIVNRLRDANALTLSLVAEVNNQVIGHIAFSPVLINGEATNWYGLAPVSVLPEQQGKGIGKALINEGLAQLKEHGAEGFVLLGEPEYYGRFGFKAQPELTLTGVPAEYFLALPVKGSIPTGEVSYHPAFFE
ncbi:GNAT family N-acetyltransferase [Photobacterium angustum]|uniref:N-acetyltransferase n=1 Tax=Photobacterium angustum TaxID=661 RepID=A0A855S7G5_PHOAN|nr:N-acetyltransferase [Photobacterium angustum]KJF82077.1 acetyltransferase [Photobacterium damselae subsp. damselae]KJG41135.1 acetyltransferase [Photobacterium angustum]KJG45916.1 acetyltransferase [Photobacterium angustum]KJG48899.1 acetyltransferase [Photobacterium angustum]KJG52921.1 acetyltransferase [Photobacterium angustum]